MKVQYEVYKVNSKVWAISEYLKKEGSTHHYAIFPCIVSGVFISTNKETGQETIEYDMKTPKGDIWGDSVNSDVVSDNFQVLVEKLKLIWEQNANVF